jgi:hypothetical protein
VPGARSPGLSLVYRLGPRSRVVGGIAVFGMINRALVQRTAGLLEHARREARLIGGGGGGAGSSGDPACYGPAFTYTEFMPTGNAVTASVLSLTMGLVFATLTFIAPVRVLYCATHTELNLAHFFIAPVGVQASGVAARLWAGRQVRTCHSSHLTAREELTCNHYSSARLSAVD